jgi:RNA polymerase sigma-54 factor
LKAGLQLKLAQHLTLTPQLQQSIRLLQLSTLELQQEIATALAENPLLELAEPEPGDEATQIEVLASAIELPEDRERLLDGSDDFDAFAASDTVPDSFTADALQTGSASVDSAVENATPLDANDAGGDFDAPSLDLSEWGSTGAGSFEDDDESFESQRATPVSLVEHLRSQLAFVDESPEVTQLVRALVESVDENGFLSVSKEDIDALIMQGEDAEPIADADWAAALVVLQGFDPPGVGASDLRECLLLQLDVKRNNADVRLARRIVSDALEHLGKRDYARIKKLFDIDDVELKAAHTVIKTLTPRPGAPFADVSASQMVPDVIVRRSKRRWVAELNLIAVPRLSVNAVYADMLQREKEGRSTPLSTQLQEARWLVKNVAQRFDTILRVSSEIVERQQAFFDHGEVAMRPLVLREVADVLGLHESTVSRVTTQKYLSSMRGSFELKYFFGSHVATDAGGAASSTAIRAMIKTLISEEDTNEPLTDSRIAELLGEQGIIVARRTVAKYRELQNIAPVNLRRRG